MLDIMVGKVERGFTTMNKLLGAFLMFLMVVTFSSCNDDQNQNRPFIPSVPVNITVNTDLPLHFHLKNLGSFAYFEGGNRGVFLVHNFDDQFYALERTCAFEPDRACSRVEVDSLNFQLRCGELVDGVWEECCASKYSFDGNLQEGPAQFPLRRYAVQFNGSLITVRN